MQMIKKISCPHVTKFFRFPFSSSSFFGFFFRHHHQMKKNNNKKQQPLPIIYVSHLRTFMMISLFLYPLIFGAAWGYTTIPAVA
jgi:hypothetical protein